MKCVGKEFEFFVDINHPIYSLGSFLGRDILPKFYKTTFLILTSNHVLGDILGIIFTDLGIFSYFITGNFELWDIRARTGEMTGPCVKGIPNRWLILELYSVKCSFNVGKNVRKFSTEGSFFVVHKCDLCSSSISEIIIRNS